MSNLFITTSSRMTIESKSLVVGKEHSRSTIYSICPHGRDDAVGEDFEDLGCGDPRTVNVTSLSMRWPVKVKSMLHILDLGESHRPCLQAR